MAYWMLFIREGGAWSPQFGDHEQACVEEERADMLYSDRMERGAEAITRRDTRILRFPRVPSQKQVEAKTKELNQ